MPPHEAPSRAAQDAEWSASGRCGGVVECELASWRTGVARERKRGRELQPFHGSEAFHLSACRPRRKRYLRSK